ncbi:hypothetical protein [Burkholderia ubonensis]|uniref:hypothetical protein n=1 Tax=Burkholderia ubonensis TaxID=101571 RepID=UPI0012FB76C1|nr:hypothetical protein [Burkholderia ubonensis]
MNCKKGDLAYISVPAGFDQQLAGRVVEVGVDGDCENQTIPHPDFPCWMCRFATPWTNSRGYLVSQCWLHDSWLRPIGGVPVEDEIDEDSKEPA